MITIEEAKKAMDEMMAQGTSEDDMLGILYLMFQDDKISFDELEALVDALGYEITEEFRNMSPEDQKTKGYEMKDEAEEGVTDEQIEDAKETKDSEVQGNNESDEDGGNGQGEDQNADNGDEKQPESEKENDTTSEEDKEAEERAKARKLYGFKD